MRRNPADVLSPLGEEGVEGSAVLILPISASPRNVSGLIRHARRLLPFPLESLIGWLI